MVNLQVLAQEAQQQKVQVVKLCEVELAIRLSIFYKNEILVKYVMKKAKEDGYNNQGGLVITYDENSEKYVVISSSDRYNYITRIINKI